jgi:flagellar biosynthesis GTPase FlhF
MKSKFFFPVPHIPIRPAALIATASGNNGGAGALGNYGLNVGPMVISWLFRFVNGRLELFMGKALAAAHKAQNKVNRKQRKAEQKEQEKKDAAIAKEERKAARKARRAERAERESRKKAEEASGTSKDDSGVESATAEQTDTDLPSGSTKFNVNASAVGSEKEDAPSITSKQTVAEDIGAMDELD